MLNNVSVVILCGGKGSRMGVSSEVTPKPLVHINGKPMLHHICNNLLTRGFKEFILATGHLSKKFDEFVSSDNQFIDKDKIIISNAGENAGMLKRIYHGITSYKDTILVCYGDTYLDIDFEDLINKHIESKCSATIVTGKIKNPFGIVSLNSINKTVESFVEKPVYDYYIGCLVLNKKVILQLNEDLVNQPDGQGIVLLFQKLIEESQLHYYSFDGLQVTFNTQDERVKAENILSTYFTMK